MSDRVCIRGCTVRDVHWATCVNNSASELAERARAEAAGEVYAPLCKGCAPRECRDGSLICDQCFGRARALLSDAPDLLGRLRSLGDPSKSGWNWDRGEVIHTSSPHPPAPIGDDLIDAIHAVEDAVRFFGLDIASSSNDADAMAWLGPLILDRHTPDEDGVREGWSVRDAVDRWGVERKDTHRFPRRLPSAPHGSYARFDEEEEAGTVTEWYDPLLTPAEAASLRGVNGRTARKWLDRDLLGPIVKMRNGRHTVRKAYASRWFAVNPCLIVHEGEWCTRVDGHEGPCGLRPGTRPQPRHAEEGEARAVDAAV